VRWPLSAAPKGCATPQGALSRARPAPSVSTSDPSRAFCAVVWGALLVRCPSVLCSRRAYRNTIQMSVHLGFRSCGGAPSPLKLFGDIALAILPRLVWRIFIPGNLQKPVHRHAALGTSAVLRGPPRHDSEAQPHPTLMHGFVTSARKCSPSRCLSGAIGATAVGRARRGSRTDVHTSLISILKPSFTSFSPPYPSHLISFSFYPSLCVF